MASLAVVACLLFLFYPSLAAPSNGKTHEKSGTRPRSPATDCLHVNTTTHRIVDPDGRERYFHGVNVVVKGPPWHPELKTFDPLKSFVEKDMQTLQDLGLNAIRYSTCLVG